MAINAVSSVSGAGSSSSSSGASSSKLSEDTKKKLKALGLDPSQYTSEAEAQAAIQEAMAKQTGQKPNGADGFKQVEEEAKTLAAQMGISVGNNDKLNDIMDAISSKIGELQASAGSDESKLAQVTDYSNKFSAISSELAQLQAAHNMTGATALGNYNKAALGLAA